MILYKSSVQMDHKNDTFSISFKNTYLLQLKERMIVGISGKLLNLILRFLRLKQIGRKSRSIFKSLMVT